MLSIFTNWKTSIAGLATLLPALGDLITQAAHGFSAGISGATISALIGGIGLIFAHDGTTTPAAKS